MLKTGHKLALFWRSDRNQPPVHTTSAGTAEYTRVEIESGFSFSSLPTPLLFPPCVARAQPTKQRLFTLCCLGTCVKITAVGVSGPASCSVLLLFILLYHSWVATLKPIVVYSFKKKCCMTNREMSYYWAVISWQITLSLSYCPTTFVLETIDVHYVNTVGVCTFQSSVHWIQTHQEAPILIESNELKANIE